MKCCNLNVYEILWKSVHTHKARPDKLNIANIGLNMYLQVVLGTYFDKMNSTYFQKPTSVQFFAYQFSGY